MNRFHLSLALLVFLFVVFGASVLATVSLLPERVATHFDAAGEPNAWMTRGDHLGFMTGFGLAFPLGIIGICWSIRFLPTWCVNIPHNEYWLAKERRAETDEYLFHHSIWFGCLGVGFVTGLHWATVFSNLRQPVQLPVMWVVGIAGSFLCGTAVWVICLYRRFRLPDSARTAPGTTFTAILLLAALAGISRADEAPSEKGVIVGVEGQPLAANVTRVIESMQSLGSPLKPELVVSLNDAAKARDARRLQELLAPQVLFDVHINPESRVKVKRGPALPSLQQFGFTPVLIKVLNDSTVTKRLRMLSPQSGAVYAGVAKLSMQRQRSPELMLDENKARSTDRLPNLAIPEMNGVGAMEICVTTAEGVCDFISAMDTRRIQEWNTWYHILNCGFPLKVSGETDFPCMSSRRVGQGRVYVQLGVPTAPEAGCSDSSGVALSLRDRKRDSTKAFVAGSARFESPRFPVDRASCRGATGLPFQQPLPHAVLLEGHQLATAPREAASHSVLDFGAWCDGLAKGRSYVSDGFAHALDFRVNGNAPGFENVKLSESGSVTITAKVNFAPQTPETVAQGTVIRQAGQRLVGDTVELHGPRSDRLITGGERLVEIIVNGQPVASKQVPADGQPHDLTFDVKIPRSSWIALRHFPQLHTNPVNVLVANQPIRASRDSARWCDEVIDLLWKNRQKVIPEAERAEALRTFEKARATYRRIVAECP